MTDIARVSGDSASEAELRAALKAVLRRNPDMAATTPPENPSWLFHEGTLVWIGQTRGIGFGIFPEPDVTQPWHEWRLWIKFHNTELHEWRAAGLVLFENGTPQFAEIEGLGR